MKKIIITEKQLGKLVSEQSPVLGCEGFAMMDEVFIDAFCNGSQHCQDPSYTNMHCECCSNYTTVDVPVAELDPSTFFNATQAGPDPCSEPLDNFTMVNYGITEWEFCAKCESGSYTDEECVCCHKWRCTAGECDIDDANGEYYSQEQCEGQCEPEVDNGGIVDYDWAAPEGKLNKNIPGRKFNMLKKKPIKIKESDITRLVKKLKWK